MKSIRKIFKFRPKFKPRLPRNTFKFLKLSSKAITLAIASNFILKSQTLFSEEFFEKHMIFLEEELKPKVPIEIEVFIGDSTTPTKFLVIKVSENQTIAVLSECPHEKDSSLNNSIIIRDKLVCMNHGCEFNLLTGEVDNPPAIDNLLLYSVQANSTEKGTQLILSLPKQLIKKSIPLMCGKTLTDYRKVIIAGIGPAGVSCAETLRKMGFSGSIQMFTKEVNPPVYKQKFTKIVDGKRLEEVFYRDEKFFSDFGIDIHFGNPVKRIYNDFYQLSYLKDSTGQKYIYDVLVLATGQN